MKKIAIVTLFGNTNYGNRLQNLAVQMIFEKRGFQADTLDFYADKTKRRLRAFKQCAMLLRGDAAAKRNRALKKFNAEYIHVRPVYAPGWKMPAALKNEYDFFAVGSDQVWNPEIRRGQRDILFLKFADEAQRVAVAPSIGISRIADADREEYRENLRGFPYLSCREDAGAEEIQRIAGKECAHLIDPTLAISPREWRQAASAGRNEAGRKYAVAFFLGGLGEEIKSRILAYCAEKQLDLKMITNRETNVGPLSPLAFVDLIDRAAMVFTDSFHGTAFSVNLETPFYVFDRVDRAQNNNRTTSRIESLVKMFGLQDRRNASAFAEACDFTAAENRLAREREKFDAFIDRSLGIEGRE